MVRREYKWYVNWIRKMIANVEEDIWTPINGNMKKRKGIESEANGLKMRVKSLLILLHEIIMLFVSIVMASFIINKTYNHTLI
jgi:hypothetical protein